MSMRSSVLCVLLVVAGAFCAEAGKNSSGSVQWKESVLYEGYGVNLPALPDAAAFAYDRIEPMLDFDAPAAGRCDISVLLPDLTRKSGQIGLPTKVVVGVLSRQNASGPWEHKVKAVVLRGPQVLSFTCRAGEHIRLYGFSNLDQHADGFGRLADKALGDVSGVLPGEPVRANLDVTFFEPWAPPQGISADQYQTRSFEDKLSLTGAAAAKIPREVLAKLTYYATSPQFRDTAVYHGAIAIAANAHRGDSIGVVTSYYTVRTLMSGKTVEGFCCMLQAFEAGDWSQRLPPSQELGFAPTREEALDQAERKIKQLLQQ